MTNANLGDLVKILKLIELAILMTTIKARSFMSRIILSYIMAATKHIIANQIYSSQLEVRNKFKGWEVVNSIME